MGDAVRESAPAPTVDRPTNRVWFAQALRGVAALIVVVEHLTQDWINAQDLAAKLSFTTPIKSLPVAPLHEIPQQLARYHISPGIFGVGLFFLISGFVIPFSLERRTLGGFFVRRFFRLYPTLWVCMGVTILAVLLLSGHAGFPYSGSTLGTNALLVSSYASRDWVDPVYWTLAVEELFYVAAALMASRGLLNRRTTIIVLGGVLALLAVWIGNPRYPTVANPTVVDYYVPRFHLGFNSTFVIFILVGVVINQHYRRVWRTWECLAIGAGLLVLFRFCLENGPFMGNQSAVFFSCALAALVVFLVLYAVRDRIPYSKAVDRLAEISYPLYLIHTIVGWVMLSAITRATDQFYVALAITFPTVFVLAAVVHHFVERPSMERGRRIANRTRFRRVTEDPVPEPVAL
ncbi:MAG: acyltransferase family protein [Acidimicrobiales bacterium]